MAVFKCKMCGGTLEINNNETVATCEYCGTKQTLPKANDEVIQNLFNRANNLRIKCEFDKAEQLYEKIVEKDSTEAEAYWGIILCKYGIEYVEEPDTLKRIPTCHRTSYEAVTASADYKASIEYADEVQRKIYEQEAENIDKIQKAILEIVKVEKPFDVFICYKETDENGKRTIDSSIVNDIYHQLTQEGFKVFYAAITLEDKIGQEYEPYIFAALNSAKVMLVVGTKIEYFEAVWVKNEWSRFMKLMKNDRSKMLIPCYRDMDAYDLPEDFAHLQAQDMSKIGFINDVVRGIKKVITIKETSKIVESTAGENIAASLGGNANVEPLLRRAFMFLEDDDWNSADEYCEKVLDIDPENAQAYLAKLMAYVCVNKKEELCDCEIPLEDHKLYHKILRFADKELTDTLIEYNKHIKERNENKRLTNAYNSAVECMNTANSAIKYQDAAELFRNIAGYKDADSLAEKCIALGKDRIYAMAKGYMHGYKVDNYERAIKEFQSIVEWRNSKEQIELCYKKIEEINRAIEQVRLENEKKEEQTRRDAEKRAKKNKKIAIAVVSVAIIAIVVFVIVSKVVIPSSKYNNAVSLMKEGKYAEAIEVFESLGNYKDSKEQILASKYDNAVALKNAGKYIDAIEKFENVGDYKDSEDQIIDSRYSNAVALKDEGKYTQAIEEFKVLGNYKDSIEQIADNEVLMIKQARVGQVVSYGEYEQDNNTSNGKEAIEWQVLAIKNNKALLISVNGLDAVQYNEKNKKVTWENCTLRTWLNDKFMKESFSVAEQNNILSTKVSTPDNPEYGTKGGNDTTDKIFLLSIQEAKKYFKSDKERECKPTAYAKEKGTYSDCWWWLRSPGAVDGFGTHVYDGNIDYGYDDGTFFNFSFRVGNESGAVRPVLWIAVE